MGQPGEILSPSAIAMWQRCPEQWNRRYVQRHVIPPASAMIRGRGVDESVNSNMKHKRATGELLPLDEALDTARDTVAVAVDHGDVAWEEDERQLGHEKARAELINTAVALAGGHYETAAPWISPAMVQAEVQGRLDGIKIRGFLDLVEKDSRIRDTKSSKKAPGVSDAENSQQLTCYTALFDLAPKDDLPAQSPEQVLDFVVRTKTAPAKKTFGLRGGVSVSERPDKTYVSYYAIKTVNTAEDVSRFKKKLRVIRQAIDSALETGAFPPTDPSNWWCSPNWCGYHASCPYVRKGKTIS
jgi:hypothetical protein